LTSVASLQPGLQALILARDPRISCLVETELPGG
jgi:hypothetical protein